MIQVLDWLYENALRSFPFKENAPKVSGGFELANDVVLDAQFTFEAHPTDFRVTQIVSTVDDVTFTFSDAATMVVDKGITTNEYVRTSTGKMMVFGLGLNNMPVGTYTFSGLLFEPSVIHEFGGPWKGVESIAFDESAALTGILNFIEGYQFELFLSGQAIRFAVGNLYGKQISCTQFSDYPEDCDEIISSINGVVPDGNKDLYLKAGNGFVVWDDPTNHRIYIGFSFTSENDICPDIPPFPV